MFTVDITDFLARESMRDYSASVAEIGNNAGPATWAASVENAPDWQFIPEDQIDYFREWVASSGGWTRDEIKAWSDNELQALCLQWIAGDVRECDADSPDADWERIRKDQENGRIPSTVYCQDGRVYWECAS